MSLFPAMTVLRRVETLSRSYRPIFWASSDGIFNPYLRCPNQRYPQQHRIHVFSTSSGGSDDVRTVAISTTKRVILPHVLEVASSEARQVISKAPAAFMTSASTSVESSSPQDALEAAQAVMALTSPTKPLAEAMLENKANSQQVFCLHKALVAVTSWCVSLVPLDTRLLLNAIDLARRAQDLSLPLNLPLYRSLVSAIAQHSLLDNHEANLATSALRTTLQPSFFCDALLSFVQQGQIQHAILLKNAIRNRFDVEHFDRQATLEILQALEVHVRECIDSNTDKDETSNHFDPVQARQLFEMLKRSMNTPMSQQDWRQSIMDRMAAEIDEQSLSDALQQLEDFIHDEDDDSDSDDETDQQSPLPPTIDEFMLAESQVLESLETMLTQVEFPNEEEDARTNDDSEDEPVALSHSDDDNDEELDEMAKQMVYLRDSSSWMLPDVTLQLVKLNGGRDVFYSRQYEQEVLKQAIDSHPSYDYYS